MSHELEIKEDGTASMFSAQGQEPWHGLGTVIDDDGVNSEQALDLAGLNWDVSLQPMAQYMGEDEGEQVWELIDGHHSVQRDTDLRSLGTVGERYEPFQNRDAFALGDDMMDLSEHDAHWITGGSLKGGSVVWMLAEMAEDIHIAGDEDEAMKPYVMVTNSHDGSQAVTCALTAVRVVCKNTHTLALSGAKRAFKTRHTINMGERITEAKRALGITASYSKELKAVGDNLIDQSFSMEEFDNLIEHLAPMDGKDGRGLTVMMNKQDALKNALVNTDNLANIKETKWGALQAVIQYNDHEIKGRGSNQDEKRMHRILNLPNITHEAFKYLNA